MSNNARKVNPAITRSQAHGDPQKQLEVNVNNPVNDRFFTVGSRGNLPRTPTGLPNVVGPRLAQPHGPSVPIFNLDDLKGNRNPSAPPADQVIVPEENTGQEDKNLLNLTSDSEESEKHEEETPPSSSRSTTPDLEMATQVVTLRDALQAVPEFDGFNIPLEEFIEGCGDAKSMLLVNDEANLVKFLRLKIKGEAKRFIKDQEFQSLEQLENFLKKIFIPHQTVPQLLGELGRQYQRDGKSVLTFANRVRGLGSQVVQSQRVATNAAVTNEFKTAIEANVIDCFKRGLRSDIESIPTVGNIIA